MRTLQDRAGGPNTPKKGLLDSVHAKELIHGIIELVGQIHAAAIGG